MNEQCYFIFGIRFLGFVIGRLEYQNTGSTARVDFEETWEEPWESKYFQGFYHSHPGNSIKYSARDKKTMRAWVSCRWRDLICGIWDGKKETRRCYLFKKDRKIFQLKDWIIGKFYIARLR